jgi:hypothetical protein
MEIISKFFEKIVLFFAATGSILIVGGIAWLFWIIISDKAISLFLALLASIPPVVLYIGILSEFSCKKERRWKRSIKNKHKKELCESLDESINVSPSRMPLWMQYRFVRYFNSIPEYIYASDDEKQSIYNEIERSTKKVLWVLSNDSVSKSIYRGYSSDRRSELVDAVKNTLKEETKVVKDIKKRSEQYQQSILEKENNESRQRHSRDVDEFLDEYYAKDQNK